MPLHPHGEEDGLTGHMTKLPGEATSRAGGARRAELCNRAQVGAILSKCGEAALSRRLLRLGWMRGSRRVSRTRFSVQRVSAERAPLSRYRSNDGGCTVQKSGFTTCMHLTPISGKPEIGVCSESRAYGLHKDAAELVRPPSPLWGGVGGGGGEVAGTDIAPPRAAATSARRGRAWRPRRRPGATCRSACRWRASARRP